MANTVFNFDDALGSAVSPEQWASYVLEHLSHESVALASGARRVDTAHKQIHVPRLLDDGSTGWFDELEEIVTDAPEGDDLVLTPKKVAALTILSNEVVSDSDPAVLETTGRAMVRAVALEADRAIFHGAGAKAPLGILEGDPLPEELGDVEYESIVRAAGQISSAGGRPDVVYVNPSVRRQDCRGEVGELKSDESRRDVPLSPVMAARLWELGADRPGTDRVFTTGPGLPLDYSNARRDGLVPTRKAAGLPWVTFHSFRHTCASLLFAAGRDVAQVAAWLGHADPGFTLRTYVHLLDEGVGDPAFLDSAIVVGDLGSDQQGGLPPLEQPQVPAG